MEQTQYRARIEAVLFASGEPVSAVRLSQALNIDIAALREQMDGLIAEYEQAQHGIQIVTLNDSYQMCTKQEHEADIRQALEMKRNTPLSQAAMECLAVVAYNEPVTKSFVEQVRGVDSSQIVNNLVQKGLLEEAGRLDVPGRPITYRTTDHFLRSFEISSLQELPELPSDSPQKAEKEQSEVTKSRTETTEHPESLHNKE